MNIEEIAAKHDAVVITDKAGDIAIQQRIYNNDGMSQPRFFPDPCDFRPINFWKAATTEQIANAIC